MLSGTPADNYGGAAGDARFDLPGEMTYQPERRKQLADIERRTWQLCFLSLIITASLAFGFGLLFYPVLHYRLESLVVRHRNLPQLVLGLLILVTLSEVYVVTKLRELRALRNFIVASYMAAAGVRDLYPRDALTGVVDRSALPDILKEESVRAERSNGILTIALFDIRKFSQVNEHEGHMAGDLMLKELALVLQRAARQADTVLRYGPDEFLCLLPGTPREGGEVFARRVLKTCERVSRLRNVTLDFQISVLQRAAEAESAVAEAERDLEVNKGGAPAVRALSASLP